MFGFDDFLGFLAATCVLLTFSMRTMRSLRMIALASNIAFIAYAWRLGLLPILALHALLLPMNIFGLWREVRMTEPFRRSLWS